MKPNENVTGLPDGLSVPELVATLQAKSRVAEMVVPYIGNHVTALASSIGAGKHVDDAIADLPTLLKWVAQSDRVKPHLPLVASLINSGFIKF